MGYMNLSVIGSDMAADIAYEVIEEMGEKLLEEASVENNEFNTDGCINVAMFIEEFVVPAPGWTAFVSSDWKLFKAAVKAEKLLVKRTERTGKRYKSRWDDEDNRVMHRERYQEMLDALRSFIRRVQDNTLKTS